MKILQLNQIKLDRIIKEKDLELILNAETYVNTINKRAEDRLIMVETEIEAAKKQAYAQITTEITDQNQLMLEDFNHNLDELLQHLNNEISLIVFNVLTKIGIYNYSSENICNIIKHELLSSVHIEINKVEAHEDTLVSIRNSLTDMGLVNILLETNNSLLPEECICYSNLWSMRINVKSFYEQLIKVFSVPKKLENL